MRSEKMCYLIRRSDYRDRSTLYKQPLCIDRSSCESKQHFTIWFVRFNGLINWLTFESGAVCTPLQAFS